MADEVSYEVRDRIAHVTISNGKANALSPAVIAALDASLTRAEDAGDDVGALCITGAAGMFSGGFDLAVMRAGPGEAGRRVTEGGALITRLVGSEVPGVIACTGHAVAAGALLLLGADVRIGAQGAFRIGLIETEIGLVLPAGRASWRANASRAGTCSVRRSAPRCTPPTARPRPVSSTRWSRSMRSRRPRRRRRSAGPSCRARRIAARSG